MPKKHSRAQVRDAVVFTFLDGRRCDPPCPREARGGSKVKRLPVGAAVVLALTLGPIPVPAAVTAAPASDPMSIAVEAADRAVGSGLDTLRAGTDEKYERRNVTPGHAGVYYVSYERTYRGLRVVGGDAVVVADSAGKIRDKAAAAGLVRGVAVNPRVSATTALGKAR